MKLTNVTNQITTERLEAIKAAIADKSMSKGAAIKEMFANGYEVKDISTTLGIKYNHCYNVIQNEILVHGLSEQVEKSERSGGKKERVLALLQEGYTVRQASELMGMLYNSVWQIAKAAGLTTKQKADAEAVRQAEKADKKKEEVA